MSFSTGMVKVATDLIHKFGAEGKLVHNDNNIDPISGIVTGVSTTEDIEYFRTFYEDRELIDNRIINGDGKLLVVLDHNIKDNWTFEDHSGEKWDIISTTPIEAQDLNIVYELHIRK